MLMKFTYFSCESGTILLVLFLYLLHYQRNGSLLLHDIEHSKRWFNLEKDDNTYKRDLAKRIELINWVLENMKNPDIQICAIKFGQVMWILQL
jgi:hypothetical protein